MREGTVTAKHLRKLAEAFFNDWSSVETDSGLCLAMRAGFPNLPWAYGDTGDLLVQHHWLYSRDTYLDNLAPLHGPEWEPRAWVCLFLAEQMEDEDV
jgi:hypothetical protein